MNSLVTWLAPRKRSAWTSRPCCWRAPDFRRWIFPLSWRAWTRWRHAPKCDPRQSPHDNIANLNRLLFEEEKFTGNEEDYDDPRNSYLNDVLDRKAGIPITLALVYQEVARRCGLPVVGVGFPGHFLAKYLAASEEILLDPYHGGAILTLQDCEEKLKAQFGEETEFRPSFLAVSPPKQTLTRMLNNL